MTTPLEPAAERAVAEVRAIAPSLHYYAESANIPSLTAAAQRLEALATELEQALSAAADERQH